MESNVCNIFADPSFKHLHYGQLYRHTNGNIEIHQELYAFYPIFTSTIMLVLEKYFNNPYALQEPNNQVTGPKESVPEESSPKSKTFVQDN